ncbi:uncharacterized protein LOC108736477, partial [Agrilus planipennis]|uniref:Uncharacterized protein LOC108736477 n=1 Tax=Agrilus planipennis TaxID=224129 RepID=A0A1W4WKG5_AGRPL
YLRFYGVNNDQTTIHSFVTTTHQQLRNLKDTLQEQSNRVLDADDKYLNLLGFNNEPRIYPKDIWSNTSLPIVVSYVMEGQESQAVGLINNFARILPNNTILIYNLGLGNYGLKTLYNYCNHSRCQVITYSLTEYPSHVEDEDSHAFRPLIIQDALQKAGAILFVECDRRLNKHVTTSTVLNLYDYVVGNSGIMTWPLPSKNAVSSRTHKKMFEYFHTDADNFLFLEMVSADSLLIVNTKDIHHNVMLPWVQCALIQNCIHPIGAQSAGCRFNKKPQYRYSGCHSYDASALNIVLGIKFKFDNTKYTYQYIDEMFRTVDLRKAVAELQGLEQNATSDGKMFIESST